MAVSAADDAIVVPFSKIRNISCAADATINISCDPAVHDPTGADADVELLVMLTELLVIVPILVLVDLCSHCRIPVLVNLHESQ